MTRATAAVWCAVVLSAATVGAAQTDSVADGMFRLDLALADMPANAGRGAYWPAMSQTRSITASFCELMNSSILLGTSGIRNPFVQTGATLGLEACALLLNVYVPFGVTWMHEEYHRAVLSGRGISSYDGVYDFNLDATAVSVYHVSDEALENLKAEHPEELVRCEEAGYEAQVDLTDALLRDGMMHGARLVEPSALYSLFSISFYIWFNTTSYADEETREFNAKETTIDQRDIVGWDFSAWTYDLHRPNEPYAARGIHPSGTGINRYILWSQLTSSEQSYLRLQAALSLVNFIRPQLYGVKPWQCAFGGGQCALTGGLTHYLTPFGYMIGAYGMARAPGAGIVAGVNMYANGRLALPGINVSLVDVPVVFASPGLFWSPRLSLWLQPSDQRFYDNAAAAGGLMSQRLDIRLSRFASLYTELEAKTKGWAAGTVDMGAALSLRAGTVFVF